MTRRKQVVVRDPYDGMADAELSAHVHALYVQQKVRSVPVSLRMPEDLLVRVKAVAAASQVRYQTLIKGMIERGTADLERKLRR